MAIVKKISELTPKGSALANTDLLIVGVDNGTDYDLKSVTGAQVLGNVVSQTITDGVTTKSPSENVVFDALANKVDKVTGSRLITSSEATILGNTSGTNTGDQDLSGYALDNAVVKLTGGQIIGGSKTFSSNSTYEEGLRIKHNTTNYSLGYTGLGASANSLIIGNQVGVSEIQKTLTFPVDASHTYTFPSSDGTLALTSDLTSKVDSNTAITGATKTKITYDSKGLVTSGSDATTADIADSTNKRYVTDANLTVIGNTSGTNTGDQIISDATISLTDITTNNFSTTKHGFVPKGTNTGKYLKDDGTWSTISAGGLTYFTEAQSTASPNSTVNVDSLTAIASTTNADFVIRPKGTGAILAAIPDNTSIGGDKRGANAVDLQTIRTSSSRVANGNYSVITGGNENTASNTYSSVLGGYLNTASGQYSSNLGGYATTVTGNYSGGSGYQNQIGGNNSFGAGASNITTANNCAVFGSTNTLSQQYCFAGGDSHTLSNFYCTAFGTGHNASGYSNFMTGLNAKSFGVHGRQSVGAYYYSTTGDNQSSTLILSARTTSATPKILGSVNPIFSTIDATTQLTLQNNNAMRVKGSIIAKQNGTTNVGAWDIDFVVVRGANAGTTAIVTSNVNLVTNASSWGTPTITADTSIGCPTITVTGVATTNIQWGCSISSMEVIY
jgi:hypothetical protein